MKTQNSTKSSCLEFCLFVVWHTVLNAERAGREVGEAAAHHLSQAPNQFTLTLSTLSTRPSLLYNTLISPSTTQTSNHPHCLYKPHTNQVNYQLLKLRSGTDMRFVKNFTRPDFWTRNFTHKKCVNLD